jgi:NADPH:quinone reductase-like Zn-dependent oxidoreductase
MALRHPKLAMRYVELTHFGEGGLAIREKDVPRPGANEVLVRVHANSLNYRDLLVVKGLYDPKMRLPRIPLSDGAGEVAETGPGVTRFKTGDRVAAIFMQSWIAGPVNESYGASALGGAIDGMAAEYVVLNENGLVAIPEHLTYEQAATLPCAGVTAWNALMVADGIRPGETVLAQGTGGVSIFALQFARVAGARVIITSSSDEKLERARKLGASDGINYKENPEWSRAAKRLTGGKGADHIVEVGGGGTFAQSLHAARTGGHISMIGILTGVTGDVPTVLILHKSIQIHGIYVGSREMFEEMNRALKVDKIEPIVDRVFGLEEINEALAYMESGRHFGKIVIRQN